MLKNDDSDDEDGAAVTPDWKKKKIDDDERLTLRIDAIEADKWQAKQNKSQSNIKRTKTGKISKKVRQLYDDEELEDDGFDEDVERSFRELRKMQTESSNGDSSLLDALAPSERVMIEQRAQLQTLKQQENAGKLNAIQQADTLARRAGLERSQVADDTKKINEAIYNPRQLRTKSMEQTIKTQTGIKGDIMPRSEKKIADGVKQVKKTAENRKVQNIKIDDVKTVKRHNMSDNQTAEMILKKSGQEAKLAEIKKQNFVKSLSENQLQSENKLNTANNAKISPKPQNGNDKESSKSSTKSYSQQVKNLLRDTLNKNKSARS